MQDEITDITPVADSTPAAAALEHPVVEHGPDVEVKGWRNGLLLILPTDGPWDGIMEAVDARLDEAKARSFWRGAQTTLVCGLRSVSLAEMDALISRVKRAYGLVPIAVVAVDTATRAAGEKLALVAYSELPVVKRSGSALGAATDAPHPTGSETAERSSGAAATTATPAASAHNALYLRQTVRSGQRIVADGHLIVCGDVNAGAEIVARGDIVVFGTLRGLAHAGFYGDDEARIVARNLRPPQLRISGKIARAPEEAGAGKSGAGGSARGPEVARIENGEIQVFPA